MAQFGIPISQQQGGGGGSPLPPSSAPSLADGGSQSASWSSPSSQQSFPGGSSSSGRAGGPLVGAAPKKVAASAARRLFHEAGAMAPGTRKAPLAPEARASELIQPCDPNRVSAVRYLAPLRSSSAEKWPDFQWTMQGRTRSAPR